MKKIVYITGAGRGIGQAIALRLADEGYLVSGCSRTAAQLEETKQKSKGKIRTTPLDVTNEVALKAWFETEERETKATPYGLITAAGIYGPIGPFLENSWDEWKRAIDINLYGTILPLKIFSQRLIKDKIPGRVILLSGGGATQPLPNFSSYGACKAAVVRFGETLAHELKSFNISINSIAPGAVVTEFTKEALKAGPEKLGKEGYEKVRKQIESGGTSPEKPAALCSYLLSDEAATITGRLISAVWDPWATLHKREDLEKSDIYTLRRIVPEDRQKDWSK